MLQCRRSVIVAVGNCEAAQLLPSTQVVLCFLLPPTYLVHATYQVFPPHPEPTIPSPRRDMVQHPSDINFGFSISMSHM